MTVAHFASIMRVPSTHVGFDPMLVGYRSMPYGGFNTSWNARVSILHGRPLPHGIAIILVGKDSRSRHPLSWPWQRLLKWHYLISQAKIPFHGTRS